jgi:competence protein ComEA
MRIARTLALGIVLSAPLTALASGAVDINSADAETLAAAMDGIGLARAQAIVDYRQANGPFRSVDDLAAVKGVGDKTLERNRDRLTVGAERSAGSVKQ